MTLNTRSKYSLSSCYMSRLFSEQSVLFIIIKHLCFWLVVKLGKGRDNMEEITTID
jgi:hypothetical protein